MEHLPLTHPLERRFIGVTLLALLAIVFWKAGEPSHGVQPVNPSVHSR